MAAARAVARDPGAYARQPPSLRAARLPRLLFLLAVVAAVGPRDFFNSGSCKMYAELAYDIRCFGVSAGMYLRSDFIRRLRFKKADKLCDAVFWTVRIDAFTVPLFDLYRR